MNRPKAKRKVCPKCKRMTFVCVYCCERKHSLGTGEALTAGPSDTLIDRDYSACDECYRVLKAQIEQQQN